MKVSVGIDVGSAAVKLAACAVLDSDQGTMRRIESGIFTLLDAPIPFVLSRNIPTRGESLDAACTLLDEFRKTFNDFEITGICVTGNGGNALASHLGSSFENSFKSLARAASVIYPDVRTVLELGGESARYMEIKGGSIIDYGKNGECAAGTGAFIEQQAARLKYSLEEVGDAVIRADTSALIAGRCSVFAKTDMIHAQQKGYSQAAILRGLCEAVVRNFKGTVCRGKDIHPKVLFVGGLALNKGIVDALKRIFEIPDDQFIVPKFPASLGSIGCALIERDRQMSRSVEPGAVKYRSFSIPDSSICSTDRPSSDGSLAPLSTGNVVFLRDRVVPYSFEGKTGPLDVYLGIDIGSVSTNLALIDDSGNLVKEIYVRTEGKPIEVVNRGLRDIGKEFGSRINVRAVGTTGSGRELIGTMIGADAINDEITAHKTGALYISERLQEEKVDTIFEIGGQDSKFIAIDQGAVVDFTMNEACAAGTGSFLEEQAERLGINIVKEFSTLAFRSASPVQFGERCTVFIESDINTHIHHGTAKENIVAGLAYSIAVNYLNRVVRGRKIGNVIYFQGGTAYNDAVAAAFAMILKKRIIVPPHNGVVGAIGMAILACEKAKSNGHAGTGVCPPAMNRNLRLDPSTGSGLSLNEYSTKQFTCKACPNYCEIQQVRIGGEKAHWGDKCSDKFRRNTKVLREATIPDLLEFRQKLLMKDLAPDVPGSGPRIGFPRALTFYNRFPFFHAYFKEVGFQVILSDPSHRAVVDAAIEATAGEPCFPITLANGHILNLLRKNVDFILAPNIIDYESEDSSTVPYACPWTITQPFVARCQPVFEQVRDRLLIPTLHFSRGKERVGKELALFARSIHATDSQSNRATAAAYDAQSEFASALRTKGAEVVEALRATEKSAVVLVGRPYNIYDPTVNLNLAGKLRSYYGVNVVPFDFLDIDPSTSLGARSARGPKGRFHRARRASLHGINENMYWHCGRQILKAALAVRELPDMHIIYVTNFKCGPDSYVKHYVGEASGKSFLTLQFDGHGNDAGMVTRCEAYLHSKGLLS